MCALDQLTSARSTKSYIFCSSHLPLCWPAATTTLQFINADLADVARDMYALEGSRSSFQLFHIDRYFLHEIVMLE